MHTDEKCSTQIAYLSDYKHKAKVLGCLSPSYIVGDLWKPTFTTPKLTLVTRECPSKFTSVRENQLLQGSLGFNHRKVFIEVMELIGS